MSSEFSVQTSVQIHDVSPLFRPVRPTLHWLGNKWRLRVLRFRDRLVPWQMRHFYYHYEEQAKLGTYSSINLPKSDHSWAN